MPGIERNVSGILLNVGINREHVDHNGTPLPEWSMLLDAGEGTYAQMVSAYGPKVDVVLQNLKCVHISHIHADHHLGIVQVLQERNTLLGAEAAARNPLLIIAPRQLERWLADYTTAVSQELHYTIVGHGALYQGNNNCPELLKEAGLVAVESINVAHCKSAVGAIIIHKDGWKLVYSGDTRPCNALVSAGQGATLLIHEATFPDDMMVQTTTKKTSCIHHIHRIPSIHHTNLSIHPSIHQPIHPYIYICMYIYISISISISPSSSFFLPHT